MFSSLQINSNKIALSFLEMIDDIINEVKIRYEGYYEKKIEYLGGITKIYGKNYKKDIRMRSFMQKQIKLKSQHTRALQGKVVFVDYKEKNNSNFKDIVVIRKKNSVKIKFPYFYDIYPNFVENIFKKHLKEWIIKNDIKGDLI